MARFLCQKLPPRFEWKELAGVGELAMIEAAPRYIDEAGPFWTFVYLRVRGAMLDFVNGSTKVEIQGIRRFAPAWGAGAFSDCRLSRSIDLERAVQKLSRQERQVLQQLGQGETGREIAASLGISEARVSQVRKQARGRLRVA
jgi:DNA-directed RNA polymerase specialized sigma subunit